MGKAQKPEHPLSVWQKNLKMGDLIGICNSYGMHPGVFLSGAGKCEHIHTILQPGDDYSGQSWYGFNGNTYTIPLGDSATGGYSPGHEFYSYIRYVSVCRRVESPVWKPDAQGIMQKTGEFCPAGFYTEWLSSSYMSRRLMPYPEKMLSKTEREHYEIIRNRLLQ